MSSRRLAAMSMALVFLHIVVAQGAAAPVVPASAMGPPGRDPPAAAAPAAAAPAAVAPAAMNYAEPLSERDQKLASTWLAVMKKSAQGPYSGLLWHCNDGTVLPPKLYACTSHGGGFMYGVLGPEVERMARMGLFVGTILTPLGEPDLSANGYYRSRALIIEKYLERMLDGWVLQSAKGFRGFRQVEDEEAAARRLLIQLAKKHEMLNGHRLLLARLIRALPYGQGTALADEIRALAGVMGDADPQGFGLTRFKIHSLPEASDIAVVDAYIASPEAKRRDEGKQLVEKMRVYYDPAHRFDRLKIIREAVRDRATRVAIDALLAVEPTDATAMVKAGAILIESADRAIFASTSDVYGERNLLSINAMTVVEEVWVGAAADLSRRPLSRGEALDLVAVLLRSAQALGWLSVREHEALKEALAEMRAGDAAHYVAGFESLRRALDWARARLISELFVALQRYGQVEPRSAEVIDDQLRTSLMVPLAALFDRLSADVERLRGGGHRLVGLHASAAEIRGENPGFAVGPLKIVPAGTEPKGLERNQIVLLRDLPPDLPPVAGIITVGEAGSLSHMSLLARNLGIPHASVSGAVAEELTLLAGIPCVLGVSAGRRVVLGARREFPAEVQASFQDTGPSAALLEIPVAALDFTDVHLHPLSDISEGDAGIRVGPKAAQLGHLHRLFPERVSDAAVIPFGVFVQHVDRPGPAGEPSPLAVLRAAYAETRGQSPEDAEPRLLGELEKFRTAIRTLPFVPGFEGEVDAALKRLGRPGTFGVFVRSDTNVEDLPQFTGAGLNLTLPNRVHRSSILAAIREVWASPYGERAFRWRQRVLVNPEYVFPSVLLHRTVPSEMSGVMVTTDVDSGDPTCVTVSVSEGVSAVVDGGSPETVVLMSDGGVRLLASSRTATRKVVATPPAEGITVSAAEGREPLLGKREIAELRGVAAEVLAKMPLKGGLPWDIEFGMVRGKLYLLQIRPLRTSRSAVNHPTLRALDEAARLPAGPLSLDAELP